MVLDAGINIVLVGAVFVLAGGIAYDVGGLVFTVEDFEGRVVETEGWREGGRVSKSEASAYASYWRG